VTEKDREPPSATIPIDDTRHPRGAVVEDVLVEDDVLVVEEDDVLDVEEDDVLDVEEEVLVVEEGVKTRDTCPMSASAFSPAVQSPKRNRLSPPTPKFPMVPLSEGYSMPSMSTWTFRAPCCGASTTSW
jgi:hypothetical protein